MSICEEYGAFKYDEYYHELVSFDCLLIADVCSQQPPSYSDVTASVGNQRGIPQLIIGKAKPIDYRLYNRYP